MAKYKAARKPMKNLKAIFLFLLSVFLIVLAARGALFYSSRCSQPCRELKIISSTVGKGKELINHPSCLPVELQLELYKNEARARKDYTLWYRLSLKNISCAAAFIDPKSFIKDIQISDAWSRKGVYFQIWDPDGSEIKPSANVHFSKDYYPLIPYVVDENAYPDVLRNIQEQCLAEKERIFDTDVVPSGQRCENEHFALASGQSIQTTPSKLQPREYSWLRSDVAPESKLEARLNQLEDLRIKKALKQFNPPMPPPSYRVLDFYQFKKEGIYSIRAVWDQEIHARPMYPLYERLPQSVKNILINFERMSGIRLVPGLDGEVYDVRAESRIIQFKVAL